MNNYDLFKELSEILKHEINNNTCRKCKHNQSWQCNSKVFHYCGVRKSNKTNNKLLKIKCKNIACSLFENDTNNEKNNCRIYIQYHKYNKKICQNNYSIHH